MVFKKPLAELNFEPRLNNTELIRERLAEAATPSRSTPSPHAQGLAASCIQVETA